ncbi:MAG: peptide chain release factor N(5)-glutamine methyltransferase [Treponema sp.]|nr:peptide chain release factor N(5)-glutamine methyltransferase [Treponema sp.]
MKNCSEPLRVKSERITQRSLLAEGAAVLATIETPGLDAALLLADLLHTDRAGLIIRALDPVSEELRRRYVQVLERRRAGECVAYILGRKEFRGLDFTVTPDVLVPRPDTETLVEAALKVREAKTLLDLCTGSGAVAISLKHEWPGIEVWASDISVKALEVARGNAERFLRKEAIHFVASDLFDRIEGRFDIITANPPYIPTGMIESLAPEVRGEPRLALDGGEDGLGIIRRLIEDAADHLYPGGVLLIEGDPRQMGAIASLFASRGYGTVQIHEDLAGRPRVIGASRSRI